MTATHFHCLFAGDLQMVVAADRLSLIAVNRLVMVILNVLKPILFDDEMQVFANRFVFVVLYPNIKILLGMDEDLFLSLLILKSKLIKSVPTFTGKRLEVTLGLLIG